jgi:riboflavin kinase/FMN adenylyltransferase
MKFITDDAPSEAIPALAQGSVVVAGVLDGCHLGHQSLINKATQLGRESGFQVVALTFDPHPSVVLANRDVPLLTTLPERERLLRALGVDEVVVLRFTTARASQDPSDFVQDVLIDRLNTKHLVVGENFTYGFKAKGNVSALMQTPEFRTHGSELISDEKGIITSTRVREALAHGDLTGVSRMLGRDFRVCGAVVHGEHRGRELGYPTANVSVAPNAALPADGVYAGWLISDTSYPAAVSLGANSTFGETSRTLEAHLIDVSGVDLYGKEVCVEFVSRLRAMVKFDSNDELVEQMGQDVEKAKALLGSA